VLPSSAEEDWAHTAPGVNRKVARRNRPLRIRGIITPHTVHLKVHRRPLGTWKNTTGLTHGARNPAPAHKIENHTAAVALNYFAHNFIKIHRTLRVSPAMAAGVIDRLWDASDLIGLLEAEERAERAA
jgi:hypothetical protein